MEEKEQNETININKKKSSLGFTLFACIMTAIIVFLATILGQKASKVVDPNTKGTNTNLEEKVESNSNEESNVSITEATEMKAEERYAIYSKGRQASLAKMYYDHKEDEPDYSNYIYGEVSSSNLLYSNIRINYKGEVYLADKDGNYSKIFDSALKCGVTTIGNGGQEVLIWVVDFEGNVYSQSINNTDASTYKTIQLVKNNKVKNIVDVVSTGAIGGYSLYYYDIDGNVYSSIN